MYLKSIRLDGFKSFADKTIFDFQKGLTAIVGPNGSGKSNIVDAIRWVLGEQSVKSLRGYAMSDIIFSGTETRTGLNKASVTLTFDNSDKTLNSEFLEIAVKRSIYKTGENEYFLNDAKVRLKDIIELFMDVNVCGDTLNIISQGAVTDIVNCKPVERRVVIESAAGVLKYKKRKEESLRKLDKTKENLNSLNLVINELENTILPLKEEALVAQKYVTLKKELESKEIALVASDINEYYKEIKKLKNEEEELTKRLENLKINSQDTKKEEIKLELYKIDDEINEKNSKILKLTEEIASLTSEKRINIERIKFASPEDAIKNNLLNLKEEELNLVKDIEVNNNKIDNLKEKIKEKEVEKNKGEKELNDITSKRKIESDNLNNLLKEKFRLENTIDILENNIINNAKVPLSVKNILNNPRLTGVHNTIANIITILNKYALAAEVVMGASANFLIVDNEVCAKEAINYLNFNNLGRATFLPLNIIKSRKLDKSVIARLEQINGYIGILSNLMEYDSVYQNIIENQFGNVIVAEDMDAMNLISKIMEYKYRVVSLDGSIIYAGGSISGGKVNKSSTLNLKKDLEDNQNKLEDTINKINNYNEIIKNINNDYEITENKIYSINTDLVNLNSNLSVLVEEEKVKQEKLRSLKSDIEGINNLQNNSMDEKLAKIMSKLNELNIEKEKLEINLNELKEKKEDLNNNLQLYDKKEQENNQNYKVVANNLNIVSVDLGKLNVKLDNLLLNLNENYNITYEYAKNNYELENEKEIVRKEVHEIKKSINVLGEINTGSIEEYKRLNDRYTFLKTQKEDLELSINDLLRIIEDMDKIMIDKFKTTFERVSEEFSKVFKVMFQGGTGKLVLTDNNDYLNTGIDLIISPPGKKIQNTQSLSGGEKSLAAICLLFAVLNVTPSPFIVLDEVEAALDEVNVELFGEYLDKLKVKSQYILITHKKSMMEHADVLYGITMQEAGVSKVVGVKLENS